MKNAAILTRAFVIVSLCCAVSDSVAQEAIDEDLIPQVQLEDFKVEEADPAMSALIIAQETVATSSAMGVQVPLTLLAWISALGGAAN